MRAEYRYRCNSQGHLHRSEAEFWQPTAWVSLDGIRATWLVFFGAPERDLLRVMAAILAVDRLSARRSATCRRTLRELTWQRRLALRVSVECPEQWIQSTSKLLRLLSFMTDDDWELAFDAISEKPARQQLLPLRQAEAVSEIALFSGGLDSIAGLLAQNKRFGGRFLAVSACGNEVRGNAQKAALDALRSHGVAVNWLKLNHQLRGARLAYSRMEASQRSRGHGAGLMPDTTKYRDVATKRHGAYELNVFASHAECLRACRQFSDLVALDADARFSAMIPFVAAPEPAAAQAAVFDMYQRYAEEVQAYFSSARPSIRTHRPQRRKERDLDLFSAAG